MRTATMSAMGLAALVLVGCTTTRTIDLGEPPTHLHYTVVLDDGQRLKATQVNVTPDSVYWLDEAGRRGKIAATRVRYTDSYAPADPARFETLNELGAQLNATVLLRDGRRLKARWLEAAFDSTSFWCIFNREHLATWEIREVRFQDHAYGVMQGFGLGLVVGAQAGALYGALDSDFESFSAVLAGAGLGAVMGGPAGAAVGGMIGTPIVYRFELASDTHPTVAAYPVPVVTPHQTRPGLALRVTF